MKCRRCHRKFNRHADAHRREDDLESIKTSGICMLCSIRVKVPQGWDPAQLGAQGRDEHKLQRRELAGMKL